MWSVGCGNKEKKDLEYLSHFLVVSLVKGKLYILVRYHYKSETWFSVNILF